MTRQQTFLDNMKRKWVVGKTRDDSIAVALDDDQHQILFEMRFGLSDDDWSGLKHAQAIVEAHNSSIKG